MSKRFMYVSQWALKVGAPGMSLYTFDTETGGMEFLRQLDDRLSFGCSMVHGDVLYVCNECDLFPETPMNTGRVYAFRIDPETGALNQISRVETYCPFTSFLNIDPSGKYLMVSNHSWPSFVTTVERDENGALRPVVKTNDSLVNLFELNEDGSIGAMVDVCKHPYGGELRLSLLGRPHIPHPHCVMRSPSGKLYAVCDKGDGHLYIYAIENGKLKLLSRTLTDTEHSEPRYCMFHPTLPYLYVNHEHTPGDRITMTSLRYEEDGTVTEVGKYYADVSGRQPVEDPRQQQGMIITPDGKYLYTQAHGCNLIICFETQPDGSLRQIDAVPIEGEWPRSLHVSPDGRFLINCCLAGQITVYAIGEDGILSDTGNKAFSRGSGYVSFY